MTEDNILRKIQKAMALANDKRGDPNTAAIAMRQAQKLMETHNITHTKVLAANCGHDYMRSKFSVKNPAKWEANILLFVGDAFGCRVLWSAGGPEPTNKGYWSIVGPKQYVEVALYTIDVALRQLIKARNDFVADLRADRVLNDLPRGEKTKKADDFCMGWGWAIRREISTMADPDGLVKAATDAYVDEYMNATAKVKTRGGDTKKLTKEMMLGGAMGSQVKLHRPMNGDEDKTLRLA